MNEDAKMKIRLSAAHTFYLLVFINLINFCDRGIIPGSFQEFSDFVDTSPDSFGGSPSAQIGFLQSAFIIGLIAGFSGFGHAVHLVSNIFSLTAIGCSVWIVAVFFSGIAFYSKSYWLLLVARMFSGFGEASLQCTIPPWIQACAPAQSRGMWLAIFFTAIPVGTAIGYAYSSSMSTGPGWAWAYFCEAIVAIPFVLALFYLHDDSGVGGASPRPRQNSVSFHSAAAIMSIEMRPSAEVMNPLTEKGTNCVADVPAPSASTSVSVTPKDRSDKEVDNDDDDDADDVISTRRRSSSHHVPTWKEEFLAVCSQPVFVCIVLGYASQVAVLIGLSTFGSAFIMGLGYYDSETEASTIFGVLASLAGIIGTPLGGFALDFLTRRSRLKVPDPLETVEGSAAAKGGDGEEEVRLMDEICVLIYWTSLIGMLMLCCVYFRLPRALFFLIITCGCILLFMTAGAVNMAIMISIPAKHRPFGIALASICGHVFGDVPSPGIAGYLKDTLAPSCAEDTVSDACRDEADGLRWCMLLLVLWLYWSVLFFFAAWHYNQKALAKYHREW